MTRKASPGRRARAVFYAGGADGSIQVIDATGHNRTLAQPPGLGLVLGLRVDDRRGELWAVSYPRKNADAVGGRNTNDIGGLFRFPACLTEH